METIVEAKIRGLGRNYADGLEQIEIHIPKSEAPKLPCKIGERVAIDLEINGRKYSAGLRSTARCRVIWICPDLIAEDGRRTKLAQVLSEAGLKKNSEIKLQRRNDLYKVSPSSY